jgi:hypothetical protein
MSGTLPRQSNQTPETNYTATETRRLVQGLQVVIHSNKDDSRPMVKTQLPRLRKDFMSPRWRICQTFELATLLVRTVNRLSQSETLAK